uniref:Uncharacterized protein n=1 Tax=Arsenophonus endosymbiont of Trialeurodes vaporariorum TaxID=235567 RepID=A0A3B0ML76_9GAMM
MGRHISVTLGNIEPLALEDNAFDLGKIALVCGVVDSVVFLPPVY